MVTIDTSTKDMYVVWLYNEEDMLTNLLRAIVMYKKKLGAYWPRLAVVQHNNRLSMGLGDDTKVKRDDWILIDGLYLSAYQPLPDAAGDDEREPTVLECGRTPYGVAFRDRDPKKKRKATEEDVSEEGAGK